jgi:hypothetical protein
MSDDNYRAGSPAQHTDAWDPEDVWDADDATPPAPTTALDNAILSAETALRESRLREERYEKLYLPRTARADAASLRVALDALISYAFDVAARLRAAASERDEALRCLAAIEEVTRDSGIGPGATAPTPEPADVECPYCFRQPGYPSSAQTQGFSRRPHSGRRGEDTGSEVTADALAPIRGLRITAIEIRAALKSVMPYGPGQRDEAFVQVAAEAAADSLAILAALGDEA